MFYLTGKTEEVKKEDSDLKRQISSTKIRRRYLYLEFCTSVPYCHHSQGKFSCDALWYLFPMPLFIVYYE